MNTYSVFFFVALAIAVSATPCGHFNDGCKNMQDESRDYFFMIDKESKLTSFYFSEVQYEGRCEHPIYSLNYNVEMKDYSSSTFNFEYVDVTIDIKDTTYFNELYQCTPAITGNEFSLSDHNCTHNDARVWIGQTNHIGTDGSLDISEATTGNIIVSNEEMFLVSNEGCPNNKKPSEENRFLIITLIVVGVVIILIVVYLVMKCRHDKITKNNMKSDAQTEEGASLIPISA
ncbi:hypothetical protein WA158_005231 [Blastocystis sp. Blastoise]